MSIQGGFTPNKNGQYERQGQVILPLNCYLINKIITEQQANQNLSYEVDGFNFEIAVLIGIFSITNENSPNKIEGFIKDSTGQINVTCEKQKDQEIPQFIQKFKDTLKQNMYVRAIIKMRKNSKVIGLLNFYEIIDFNEIARHNLEIIVRTLEKQHGLLQDAQIEEQKNMTKSTIKNAMNQRSIQIIINEKDKPIDQVKSYFQQYSQLHPNDQIQKNDVLSYFEKNLKMNTNNIMKIISQLTSQGIIFNIDGNDCYFYNDC